MSPSASLSVFSSPDLFQCLTAFQGGLHSDMLPFNGWFAPDINQTFDRLVQAMEVLHPYWEPTMSAWYQQYGTSRLKLLFQCLPSMAPVVALEAVASGRVVVLDFLHTNGVLDESNVHLNNLAAALGQQLVMVFLDEHDYPSYDKLALDRAAERGHLSVVQYLLTKQCPSSCSLNLAAKYGHEDVVRLLHEAHAPCTTFAMDWAAKDGHLNIVKFLHTNRSEGCTCQAMSWAAANGHLDVVSFLHNNRSEGCTRQAVVKAAENGHMSVVKFLVEHRREGLIEKAREAATRRGHTHIAAYLAEIPA
ncbi:hypothetical protein AC1031_007289 [Aphanomyces cochlioides]|nr:hypothetical protein AC1031_007289 [Aphanomyces cochlioides]